MEPREQGLLLELPGDVLMSIIERVDAQSSEALASVCRSLHAIMTRTGHRWRRLDVQVTLQGHLWPAEVRQVRDNLRWWFLERLTRGPEQEVRLALPEQHGEVVQTALLALPDLAHLHLDAPTEMRLTRGLSGLSRLTRLTLTASGASHGIPEWVASLPALRALDVRMECRCSGNVFLPSRLTALTGFTELQLVGTALPDLPAWLAQLPDLRLLRVHRAALHGNNNMAVMPFPRDCPLAACLTSLELSSCNMFSLPAQVTGLRSLVQLDLTRNMLSELPPGFEALTALRRLLLRDNDFVNVPPALTQHAQIAVMQLRASRVPPGAHKLVGLAAQTVPLASLANVDLRENPQPSSRRFLTEEIRKGFAEDIATLQRAGCEALASSAPVWPRVSPTEAALDVFQRLSLVPA